MKYLIGESGTGPLIWNPNFPVGNKWEWLSSLQNNSWLNESGNKVSLEAMEINSLLCKVVWLKQFYVKYINKDLKDFPYSVNFH